MKSQKKIIPSLDVFARLIVPFLFFVSVGAFGFSCKKGPERAYLPTNYQSWARTDPQPLDYPIPGHEDRYRVPYLSPLGEEPSISEKSGRRYLEFKTGTVLIKEIYMSKQIAEGDTPVMLTAMVKAPQDQRSRGGWLWIVKQGLSGPEMIMESEFCFTCHANANDAHPYGDKNANLEFRDYVFFPYPRSVQASSSSSSTDYGY